MSVAIFFSRSYHILQSYLGCRKVVFLHFLQDAVRVCKSGDVSGVCIGGYSRRGIKITKKKICNFLLYSEYENQLSPAEGLLISGHIFLNWMVTDPFIGTFFWNSILFLGHVKPQISDLSKCWESLVTAQNLIVWFLFKHNMVIEKKTTGTYIFNWGGYMGLKNTYFSWKLIL